MDLELLMWFIVCRQMLDCIAMFSAHCSHRDVHFPSLEQNKPFDRQIIAIIGRYESFRDSKQLLPEANKPSNGPSGFKIKTCTDRKLNVCIHSIPLLLYYNKTNF